MCSVWHISNFGNYRACFCDTLAVINLIAVFTFVKRAKALQCSDWSHAVGGGGEAPLVRTPTPEHNQP